MQRAAALALVAVVASASAFADTPGTGEIFTGFAVDVGGSDRRASSSQITITVDRWSTEEERRQLVGAFREDGESALLKALQKMKAVGRISTPGSIGYDLRYAYQVPLPSGGRRIIVGTDRPMSYGERVNSPRSADYPFTVVELRLDGEGKGDGKLNYATRVRALEDRVELENYDVAPVRITSITTKRR